MYLLDTISLRERKILVLKILWYLKIYVPIL
jgi:hypothetical protein